MDLLSRYLDLFRSAMAPNRAAVARPTLRHILVTGAILLMLPVALLYHGIGMLLDELLFRGYRKVEIDAPVFVLGPPRSATTTVHEVLADDERFTTFTTWECLFGLSVSWRRFWRGVGAMDRCLGRPLGRLADVMTARLAGGLDALHPVRLDAPEEDYFALLPRLWCFLLVVPFPDAVWPWRWARFDEVATRTERDRLVRGYRRAVQRHLYVHRGKRYLAKNAAFAPIAHTLLDAFADARVVCCLRPPRAALSSQLSCLHPSLQAIHGDYDCRRFANRMAGAYGFYYRNLFDALNRSGSHRAAFVPVAALGALGPTVDDLYRSLGLEMTPAMRERVAFRAHRAAQWRSRHRHHPEELPVDAHVLRAAFDGLDQRFDFGADRVVAPATPRDELARVAGL